MKPVDFSQQNFADLRAQLAGIREAAHRAWLAHGPGTTREVSAKAGMSLLTFRPRSTELFQLGLLFLLDPEQQTAPHNGIYKARSIEEWENFIAAKRAAHNSQLQLTV